MPPFLPFIAKRVGKLVNGWLDKGKGRWRISCVVIEKQIQHITQKRFGFSKACTLNIVMEASLMRMKSPRPAENDDTRVVMEQALQQAGPEAKTYSALNDLDVLLLGPSRKPALVLPNTGSPFSGLSPSGKVAAIYSQWKGDGDLRLG